MRDAASTQPLVATESFALGGTLYEMSAVEPPYSGINSATGEIQSLYAAGSSLVQSI